MWYTRLYGSVGIKEQNGRRHWKSCSSAAIVHDDTACGFPMSERREWNAGSRFANCFLPIVPLGKSRLSAKPISGLCLCIFFSDATHRTCPGIILSLPLDARSQSLLAYIIHSQVSDLMLVWS